MTIKTIVIGASGRLGRQITKLIMQNEEMHLVGGVVRKGSDFIGKDICTSVNDNNMGLKFITLDEAPANDLIIDVSNHEYAIENCKFASASASAYLSGVTGDKMLLTQDAFLSAANEIPVLWARNLSLEIAVMKHIVEQTAKLLDSDYDIEIFEAHHRHKIDAPSGTALSLGESAAKGRGIEASPLEPHSINNNKRPIDRIGYSVMRGGEIVGEHKVAFLGDMGELSIYHKAYDRAVFAQGALRAGLWLAKQPHGMYDIKDALNLSKV